MDWINPTRWALLGLLAIIAITSSLALSEAQLQRTVDLLRPVYPGEHFDTAQDMVEHDLAAFMERPSNASYANLNRSLDLLGSEAWFTSKYFCTSSIRSVVQYRQLRNYVATIVGEKTQQYYCDPTVQRYRRH